MYVLIATQIFEYISQDFGNIFLLTFNRSKLVKRISGIISRWKNLIIKYRLIIALALYNFVNIIIYL